MAQPSVEVLKGVSYELDLSVIKEGYVDVIAHYEFDTPVAEVELSLPDWTPGSYMIRDYAGGITELHSDHGKVKKLNKSRWLVKAEEFTDLRLSYRVYGHELSVRHNWFEEQFALVCPAATFIRVGYGSVITEAPCRVILTHLPVGTQAFSGMESYGPAKFMANNYDELIDSPIVVGSAEVSRLDVQGEPHDLVSFFTGGVFDQKKATEALSKVVAYQRSLWGSVPYDHYQFYNILTGAYGGLEHHDSTVMISNRWDSSTREGFIQWMGLASHEFFHTWNIKTLHPTNLGPFNYNSEVYTPSLWIIEGMTAYYDNLALIRAGVINEKEYLKLLSKDIDRLRKTPGRHLQSLRAASEDAWIKSYKPGDNHHNICISYYNKGSLVMAQVDMEIRRATAGKKSLDNVLRLALERYQGSGYTESQFRALITEVAGHDFSEFFRKYVDGVEELNWERFNHYYGLSLANREVNETKGWFGLELRKDATVKKVYADSPAAVSGIQPQDELLAIDGFRYDTKLLTSLLKVKKPKDIVNVLFSRHGQIHEKELIITPKPASNWKLKPEEDCSKAQVKQRHNWLHLKS